MLLFHKVIAALPVTLDPDAVYFVRTGAGFDLYVTDATGSVAYTQNISAGGSAQQVFVQPSAPVVDPGTPYLWWQTGLGASGNDMTLWVEDGL